MENTGKLITDIYDNSTEYVKLQVKSAKLEVYERITNVISDGINTGFVLLFALFSFLFINLGLAYWLSELVNSYVTGFLLVGAFYFVVLGFYLWLRNIVAKNKVRNAVLKKVSKTYDDYEQLLSDQEIVHARIDVTAETVKQRVEDLKETFIGTGKGPEKTVGKVPRAAVTSVIDFVLRKVVFRNAGIVKKNVIPMVASTLVTSLLFNETKGRSLWENLKMKFSRWL